MCSSSLSPSSTSTQSPARTPSFTVRHSSCTASQVDEDELPLSRVQDGIAGDHESRPQGDLQLHIGIHPRLEPLARIHQLEADFGGTRLRLDGGVEERDAPLQDRLGVIREGHRGGLPNLDEGQFVFIDVGEEPDMGEIGNRVELIARVDMHPRQRHLLDDGAALRRMDGQRPEHLAGALQVLDMVLRNVPELQTPTGRLEQGLRPRGDLWEGTPAERPLAL